MYNKTELIVKISLLLAIGVPVVYHDMKYRRIPNIAIFFTLIAAFAINLYFTGVQGLKNSLLGLGLALVIMLLFHFAKVMSAPDVALFAAIGALFGVWQVPITLFYVMAFPMVFMLQSWPNIENSYRGNSVSHGLAIITGSLLAAPISAALRLPF